MKNKLLKFILLILAGVAVFIACRRELMEDFDSGGLTVEQAKSWYTTKSSGFVTVKSADVNKKTIEATPEWKDAQKGSDDSYDYVETHFKSSSNFILMNNQTKQEWEKIKKIGMYASLSNLVVRQNKKDKTIETFVMTMIPDKDWLVNHPDHLKTAKYFDRPKDYSGMVFYNDLNGNFVNGWKYTDGKVTHKVTKTSGEPVVRLKDTYCTTYEIWMLWGDCYTFYSGEIFYCVSYWWEYEGTYMVCYTTDDGGGGGGGYTPPEPCTCYICQYCGGCLDVELKSATTDPSNCPAPCSCPAIVEDPTFENTKADCVKTKLENGSIINNLIGGFCLSTSNATLTYLVNDISANGQCVYNSGTGRIDITIDSDRLNASSVELARTILHESFHAYMFGKLYEGEIHNGLAPEPNFKDDLNAYELKFGVQGQHNYMADRYIAYMKQGLSDYFNGESYKNNFLSLVQDNSYWYGTDFLFECLAWGGLQGTEAWSSFQADAARKLKYDQTMAIIVNLLPQENCIQP